MFETDVSLRVNREQDGILGHGALKHGDSMIRGSVCIRRVDQWNQC